MADVPELYLYRFSSACGSAVYAENQVGLWTATEVQITAGYMNILDTAWPRFRYTLPVFPGLRYIS